MFEAGRLCVNISMNREFECLRFSSICRSTVLKLSSVRVGDVMYYNGDFMDTKYSGRPAQINRSLFLW